MNKNLLAWVFLALSFGSGCSQQSESSREATKLETNATTKSTRELSDAEVGISGPWNDYQSNSGQTNDATPESFEQTSAKAKKGDALSQMQVGFYYLFGLSGVSKDGNQASTWLRKAAEQGLVGAQTRLAYGLRWGSQDPLWAGVEKNPNEAATWYLLAAKQGDDEAQFSVGEMYRDGVGVGQDFIEAYKWFNIAAASTNRTDLKFLEKYMSVEKAKNLANAICTADRARTARDQLTQFMTIEQTAEAQRLAREFRPRKKTDSASVNTDSVASGTGFFISNDGYLISNNHVVVGANQVRLVTRAGLISAKVVKVDAANDLALLKAEGRFAALPVAASRGVKLGGTVATVGFPNIGLQGFAPKLAKGEIAALSGAGDDARYFQISVPVQPGNSGGALVDERGNVVGVVSAKLNASAALALSGTLPENVNYAVKSSYLLSFLESVPDVAAKLKEASGKEKKFEDVVKEAEQAAVLVLVY